MTNVTRRLHQEVQSLKGEIESSPISRNKYAVLSQRIDGTLKEVLSTEKTNNVFAKAQMQHLKEEIVDLCGALENGLVDREISQIAKGSQSLKQGKITQRAVAQLESLIESLEEDHRPSLPHKRIIAEARFVLAEAKARLAGQKVSRHFDLMAKNLPPLQFVDEGLLPEEIEELFDIGKAIYNRDLSQARSRYNALPSSHKQRVQEHLDALGGKLYSDELETIQALFATAHELAGSPSPYLTQQHIDQFFLGLSRIMKGED